MQNSRRLSGRRSRQDGDEGEACAAIASLADHHILAIDCNNRTSVSIRKLRD